MGAHGVARDHNEERGHDGRREDAESGVENERVEADAKAQTGEDRTCQRGASSGGGRLRQEPQAGTV